MADIKAQSDKLRFPRAAAADRCGVENYKISYLCRNATCCCIHMRKMQLVWMSHSGIRTQIVVGLDHHHQDAPIYFVNRWRQLLKFHFLNELLQRAIWFTLVLTVSYMAKFCSGKQCDQIWRYFAALAKHHLSLAIFYGLFSIWQNCDHSLLKFYAAGQIFIAEKSQKLKE